MIDGRPIRKTAKTLKEVQEWNLEMSNQINAGLTYESTQTTTQDFLMGWLESKKTSLRTSTWTHYEGVIRRHVIPAVGAIKIRDLTPQHIERLYNRLHKNGVGIPTIDKIHTALHSALAHATKTGLISRNPISPTIRPKAPPQEMKFLDDNQVHTLLISLMGHRWEALFHLAVVSGMRQMEILGLKWSDLDWDNKIIQVDRQLSRKQNSGDVQFAPLKTKFSIRQVDLGDRSIQMLSKHLAQQQVARENAGDKWVENDLIFTNTTGSPIHYRNLLRDFKIILKRAGLPEIRFHDLRHTAASLMLNNGVAPLVASRRLGHARPSITLDIYGHLIPNKQAETAELMDELVTPIELPEITSSYPRLPTKQVSPE